MPTIEIVNGDISPIISAVRKIAGKDIPEIDCLTEYYSICPVGLLTPLSRFLWARYCESNRNRNETYESSLRLPAIYAEASKLIEETWDPLTNIG